jgi:ribosomal protein L37E
MRTISNRDNPWTMDISFNRCEYEEQTCCFFNEDMFGIDMHTKYKYLNFDNFDWSDFMCKKEKAFTKSDLRNGDVVKKRNGDVEIVCVDTNTLICSKCGYNSLNSYKEDLTYGGYGACLNNPYDIIKVLRPQDPSDCRFDAFECRKCGKLVYERKEVEEMTLEEVCKALGKEIKIVKK